MPREDHANYVHINRLKPEAEIALRSFIDAAIGEDVYCGVNPDGQLLIDGIKRQSLLSMI